MADGQAREVPFPDGIGLPDLERGKRWNRHAGLLALVVLTTLLGTAMTGLLGGGQAPSRSVAGPAVQLTVHTPAILRNGMFFETEISVTPRRPIADLTIAVDRSLWKDLTVNTMIPAPAGEKFADGRYRFSYGPAEAGKAIAVKIDSQINPSLYGGTSGNIAVLDGDTLLAELPVTMKVRP